MEFHKFLKAKEIISELEILRRELESYEESTQSLDYIDFSNSKIKTIRTKLTSEEFDFIKKTRIKSTKEKIAALEHQFKIL